MSDEYETPEQENEELETASSPEQNEENVSAERKKRYYDDEKISLADIQKHISGPIISIVLHIIILIVLGTVVMFDPPAQDEKEDVVVEMKEMDVETPPPPPPPPPPPEEVISDTDFVDVPLDRQVIQTDKVVMETVAEPISQVATADTAFADNMMMDSSLPEVETSNSALKLSGAFAMRSGAGRKLAIKTYGGSAQTERAVEKALDWLVSVQNEDGSWGDFEDEYNHKVQLTCYALLAFLAHGETPQSEKYGEALMKGLKRVLVWEETRKVEAGTNEEGKLKWDHLLTIPANADPKRGHQGTHRLDSLSRIGIVLAEGFAITKIPALERGMNRVIDDIIKVQNSEGGFGWSTDHRTRQIHNWFDLYNGAFAYNALYSAYNAGCELPELEKAIELSIKAIEKKHFVKKEGAFCKGAVNKDGNGNVGFNETAEGTLFLYLMGSNGREAQKGFEWLTKFKPGSKQYPETMKANSELKMDWKNLPYRQQTETPAVGWYYMTQAVFQATSGKGRLWTQWNNSMTRSLIREQHSEGYWIPPADKYEHKEMKRWQADNGSWKEGMVRERHNESMELGWSPENAKLWATTFFTLSLEVYYRYLPTFEADGTKAALVIHKGGQAPEDAAEEEVDETASDDDISLD